MSNKSGQSKQQHKSMEQLISEDKKKREVERFKKIVKDQLYPLLVKETKNIEDARVFCSAMSVAIKQIYNNKMSELKLSILEMEDQLVNSPSKDRYKKLIDILKDETVFNAIQIVEQIPQTIEKMLREEMSQKTLEDLNLESL